MRAAHSARANENGRPWGGRVADLGAGVALGARHLAGLHALGADVGSLHMSVDHSGDLLDVGPKHTRGHAVRVAHVATRGRALAANCADLRHCKSPRVLSGIRPLWYQLKAHEMLPQAERQPQPAESLGARAGFAILTPPNVGAA